MLDGTRELVRITLPELKEEGAGSRTVEAHAELGLMQEGVPCKCCAWGPFTDPLEDSQGLIAPLRVTHRQLEPGFLGLEPGRIGSFTRGQGDLGEHGLGTLTFAEHLDTPCRQQTKAGTRHPRRPRDALQGGPGPPSCRMPVVDLIETETQHGTKPVSRRKRFPTIHGNRELSAFQTGGENRRPRPFLAVRQGPVDRRDEQQGPGKGYGDTPVPGGSMADSQSEGDLVADMGSNPMRKGRVENLARTPGRPSGAAPGIQAL